MRIPIGNLKNHKSYRLIISSYIRFLPDFLCRILRVRAKSMGNVLYKEPLSEEISISDGKIVGRRIINEGNRQVNAFLGIPFAKPPLGELRFKKPLPPEPWFNVRHCTAFQRRPVQKEAVISLQRLYNQCSEDCLYLNVFSPAWPEDNSKLYPVLLYIHGGAYVIDFASRYGDIGIAKHLVAECEVVVITIEYRLGYFGFFSTGDSACDDNVGLWDATMALKWVQANIDKFHGDKNNVTLMGQSAGGSIVDLLALSPHSRDLFHKVVPMAGNANCNWALSTNIVEKCRDFANKLGIDTLDSTKMIEELQKVDASKLALSFKITPPPPINVECIVAPRIDGKFLPKPIAELRMETSKKKNIIGVCKYEGLLFILMKRTFTLGELQSYIASIITESRYPNFKELREEALNLYIDPKVEQTKHDLAVATANLISDFFTNVRLQTYVNEQLRNASGETYIYVFEHYNPNCFGMLERFVPFKGATHCTELCYLFAIKMYFNFKFDDDDMKVLHITTKLFSNFAKYGDPNGSESDPDSQLPFKWLPATMEHPNRYLVIKLEPEMKEYFETRERGNSVNFWINVLNS